MAGDRVRPSERRWLAVALATSAVALTVAVILRLLEPMPDLSSLGGRLFTALVAAAFADAAFLARHRSPAVAWFAAVTSTSIAAVEIVGALRAMDLVLDAGSTAAALALAVGALVAAAGLAMLDAARPRDRAATRLDRALVTMVALGFAGVVVAAAWTLIGGSAPEPASAALGADDLAPVRVTGRLALAVVGLGLLVGLFRDAGPGVVRGWERWRVTPREASKRSLVAHLADELVPSREAGRTQAREDERAKLAADLHALVLPDLRRAAAASSTAGVHRALEDVERLMHGRQSLVLEEFGLVAALEWLAERTEQGGGLEVEVRLDGERVDQPDAVRRDIARAAFRIALLAIDNVERHARATRATIGLRVDPTLVELRIEDDGHGAADWTSAGGRGLADMRAEAAATGGTLRVNTEPTRIEAVWRPR